MKNLFKILFLSLLVFSCDEGDDLLPPSNEIDIDWILINVPELTIDGEGESPHHHDEGNDDDLIPTTFNGYWLFVTDSSEILGDEVIIDDNGFLTFTYNGENYSYDISDSYDQNRYHFDMYEYHDEDSDNIYCRRIILNTELNYITYFVYNGFGSNFNLSTPNQLIDYR